MKKLSVGIDIGKETLVVALSIERERQIGKRADFANGSGGFKKLKGFVDAQKNGAVLVRQLQLTFLLQALGQLDGSAKTRVL